MDIFPFKSDNRMLNIVYLYIYSIMKLAPFWKKSIKKKKETRK